MRLFLRGLLWFAVYLGLVLAPGVVALIASPFDSPRPARVEFSVALGFVAFAIIATQFALVSRFQASSRPFGTDALVQFHQYIGGLALALALAHPLLLTGNGIPWNAWSPVGGPLATRTGAIAAWALVALVCTTVFRRHLRLSYETWQWLHLALAALTGVSLVVHVLRVQGYSAAPVVRFAVLAYAAASACVVLHYKFVRPALLGRRPWTVESNVDAGGSTRLLRLRPLGHAGIRFDPGQFAWLITGRSPLSAQQHPLSIASSAEPGPDGAIEFAVKALGDWSSQVVPRLTPRTRVWVDGGFGAFTTERKAGQGFVFVAGGIGVAPMRSMLLTMRDRGDRRHVVLFIAARDESRLVLREDFERLTVSLNLDLVFVLETTPDGWPGERGLITSDLLRRRLPPQAARYHYFVCGPPQMMDFVERALVDLGVPAASIDSERFNLL